MGCIPPGLSPLQGGDRVAVSSQSALFRHIDYGVYKGIYSDISANVVRDTLQLVLGVNLDKSICLLS